MEPAGLSAVKEYSLRYRFDPIPNATRQQYAELALRTSNSSLILRNLSLSPSASIMSTSSPLHPFAPRSHDNLHLGRHSPCAHPVQAPGEHYSEYGDEYDNDENRVVSFHFFSLIECRCRWGRGKIERGRVVVLVGTA